MEILRQLTRLFNEIGLWATLNEWTIKNEIIPTLSIVLMIYFCRGNGHSKKCNKMYSTRAFSKGKITISRRWQSESIGQWLETPAGDLSYCLDFSQLFDHKCIPTLTSLIIETYLDEIFITFHHEWFGEHPYHLLNGRSWNSTLSWIDPNVTTQQHHDTAILLHMRWCVLS